MAMRFLKSFCGMSLYVTKSNYVCWDNFLGKSIKEGSEDECKQYFENYVNEMKKAMGKP